MNKISGLEPIDDPTIVFGDNFNNVDKMTCDRCARVYRLYESIRYDDVDEFAKMQLDEISDVIESVFSESQDPSLITASMLEILEGIYTNQYDFSFDERKKMFESFCKKHNIDMDFD